MLELSIKAAPVTFLTDESSPDVALVKAGVSLPTETVGLPPTIAATTGLLELTLTGLMSKQPKAFLPNIPARYLALRDKIKTVRSLFYSPKKTTKLLDFRQSDFKCLK